MIYYCFLLKKFLKNSIFIVFILLFILFLLFSLRSIPLFLYKIDILAFFPLFCAFNLTKLFVLIMPLGFLIALLFLILFLKESKGFLSLGILGIGQKFWFFFWLLPYGIAMNFLFFITLYLGPLLYKKTDSALKKIPPLLQSITKNNKNHLPSFLFPGFFFHFSQGNQELIFYRLSDFQGGEYFFLFTKKDILCCEDIHFSQDKKESICFVHKGRLGYLDKNPQGEIFLNSSLIFQDYGFLLKNISLDLAKMLSSSFRLTQGQPLGILWTKSKPIYISMVSMVSGSKKVPTLEKNILEYYREWSYRILFPTLLFFVFLISFVLMSLGLLYSTMGLVFFWLLFFLSFVSCFLGILLSTWGLLLEIGFFMIFLCFFFIFKKKCNI